MPRSVHFRLEIGRVPCRDRSASSFPDDGASRYSGPSEARTLTVLTTLFYPLLHLLRPYSKGQKSVVSVISAAGVGNTGSTFAPASQFSDGLTILLRTATSARHSSHRDRHSRTRATVPPSISYDNVDLEEGRHNLDLMSTDRRTSSSGHPFERLHERLHWNTITDGSWRP